MKEEFVKYEQAVALKELGYKSDCIDKLIILAKQQKS